MYNQKVETAEINLRPAEQALRGIELPQRTIIARDVNSHHLWWNSKIRTPKNHTKFMTVGDKAKLDLINLPDAMRYMYPNGTGESVIDLTLSMLDLTTEINNWAIDKYAHSGLNHKVITFKIHSESMETVPEPTT